MKLKEIMPRNGVTLGRAITVKIERDYLEGPLREHVIIYHVNELDLIRQSAKYTKQFFMQRFFRINSV